MIINDLSYKVELTGDQAIVSGGGRIKPRAEAFSTAFADAIGGKYTLTTVNAFTATTTSVFGATSSSGAGSSSLSIG